MSWRPRYQQGDTVWVDRGAGVYHLEGQVVRYVGGRMYEVSVAGQGLREVKESALSPRDRQDYGPGPEEG